MSRFSVLFTLIFVAVAMSFGGFLVAARYQLGSLTAIANEEGDIPMPLLPLGLAQQGAEVYREQGCVACHSQMVRGKPYGSDFAHGWANAKVSDEEFIQRQSVARDYIYADYSPAGWNRLGGDLFNVGDRLNAETIHRYLAEPQAINSHSLMPSYAHLYESSEIGSVVLSDGRRVQPKESARALVAYLVQLSHPYMLPEVPVIAEEEKNEETAPADESAAKTEESTS